MQGGRTVTPDAEPDWTQKATRFFELFTQHGPEALVRNLTTCVDLLDVDGTPYPITVNNAHVPGNCYICDPVTGYLDYAVEETRNFTDKPLLRSALIAMIRSVSPLMWATGLGRSVHVNNWLFSTNPAPDIDKAHAAALRDIVLQRYPTHAVVIRSLNTHSDQPAIDALVAAGFQLLPSRQIYMFDGADDAARDSADFKRDQALLARTPLGHVRNAGFETADYTRAIELYDMLYLKKYTPLNPQYSPRYLAEMHRARLLFLEGYRDGAGQLVAVGGRFQMGRTLTQPIVGYDTSRPQKDGLYRLITALAQRAARADGLLFNMSAGAASFKRHRGATPAIEYSAVYARHLRATQRAAISGVASVLSRVGVPLLRRFEL